MMCHAISSLSGDTGTDFSPKQKPGMMSKPFSMEIFTKPFRSVMTSWVSSTTIALGHWSPNESWQLSQDRSFDSPSVRFISSIPPGRRMRFSPEPRKSMSSFFYEIF